jgi:hypothetical protein
LLNTAAQVSVGSRNFVSESGPDVMNSRDEDLPFEEHGECLTGVYTYGLKAPVVLSQSEVARQKDAAEGLKKVGFGNWIESGSNCPSGSETLADSDYGSQSVPSSPSDTRSGSRFDLPRSSPIPRAKTPTGEVPTKPTVSTAVSMPPLPKSSKRKQSFLSDSSGPSGDELPPPAV